MEFLEKWRLEVYINDKTKKNRQEDTTKSSTKSSKTTTYLSHSSSSSSSTDQAEDDAIETEPTENESSPSISEGPIATSATSSITLHDIRTPEDLDVIQKKEFQNYIHSSLLAFILIGPFAENNALLCAVLFEENALSIVNGIPVKQEPSPQIIMKPQLSQKQIREHQKMNDLKQDFTSPNYLLSTNKRTRHSSSSNDDIIELRRRNDIEAEQNDLVRKKNRVKAINNLIAIYKARGNTQKVIELEDQLIEANEDLIK